MLLLHLLNVLQLNTAARTDVLQKKKPKWIKKVM